MANTRINGSNERPYAIICKYHKGLKDQIATSKSEIEAAATQVEFLEMKRGYKLCSLKVLEETHDFYRDIGNYELLDMQKSTEIILENINKYKTKKDNLAKTITETSKNLNNLKIKLQEANNAACAMRNCLKSILAFTDETPHEIIKVVNSAKKLSENGQKAAEALVIISGIQTFSNGDGLKSFGDRLVDKVKKFKEQTDGFIKSAEEEAKKAQTELAKVIEEINKKEFENFEVRNKLTALKSTVYFICKGRCRPIGYVEKICKDMITKEEEEVEATNQTPWKDKDED